MSYGLVQSGHKFKDEAMQGLSDVARLEENRDRTNENLKQEKKNTETNAVMSGATTGAMMGSQIMPGWGTVIGGVVGAVGGWVLS